MELIQWSVDCPNNCTNWGEVRLMMNWIIDKEGLWKIFSIIFLNNKRNILQINLLV